MHGRRVALLQPLLQELNPAVYLHTHKQISLEAASAAQEKADARMAMVDARVKLAAVTARGKEGGGESASPTPEEVSSVNKTIDTALTLFSHFLR